MLAFLMLFLLMALLFLVFGGIVVTANRSAEQGRRYIRRPNLVRWKPPKDASLQPLGGGIKRFGWPREPVLQAQLGAARQRYQARKARERRREEEETRRLGRRLGPS